MMNEQQFQEGLSYAENNFSGNQSHLWLDKHFLQKRFDLANKDILDFGCGMGGLTLWLAAKTGARVDGVDLDPNHIQIAQELQRRHNITNVDFAVRNIIEQPVDKQYDYIILSDVIEHLKPEWIPNILRTLIHRNLKKNGVIFISYPPWEGPHASHLQSVIRIPWVQYLPQSWVRRLLQKRNKQLVGVNDLMTEYLELNHMTHSKLRRFLSAFQLKPVFRHSHTKFCKLPLLKNVNLNFFPFKYFVTKELVAFRKYSLSLGYFISSTNVCFLE
ncbi:class I SAM-dependent methyltransferase [Chitinophaga sp. 22620]|uniref:class I SAM-dependent methyltransferase n=1 Tax=Chitinophaga sp. 22620 TaxID=3453952 RepID=UPI003F82B574